MRMTEEQYNKEFFDRLRDQIDEWEGWAEDSGYISIGTGSVSIRNILLIAAPYLYESELDLSYKLAKAKTMKLKNDKQDPQN